jgi:integration host factor subunit alpha
MTVTKENIIKKISDETGIPTQTATGVVDKILTEMKDTLQKGQCVLISGFGKFTVYAKSSRTGRNPQTKTTMQLRPRKVVTFKISLKLKKFLNE